jgi:hypothetical protein
VDTNSPPDIGNGLFFVRWREGEVEIRLSFDGDAPETPDDVVVPLSRRSIDVFIASLIDARTRAFGRPDVGEIRAAHERAAALRAAAELLG